MSTDDEASGRPTPTDSLTFWVRGMTCASCAGRVKDALGKVPGVRQVTMDLATGRATVIMERRTESLDQLQAAVEKAGYRFGGVKVGTPLQDCCRIDGEAGLSRGWWPYLVGVAAALAVLVFYVGLLNLTSNWEAAWFQFGDYQWWLIALSLGLGVQATLYSMFRATLKDRFRKTARSALAASGGASTLAMAACCSHYLAAFLPAIGLPFLSGAAASLEHYQTWFFLIGVLANLFGIWLMLRMMARHGMIRPGGLMSRLPLGLGLNT